MKREQKAPRRILWADDEIEFLKPHIMFLESRGYEVTPVTNGSDAVAMVGKRRFDVVLLDEMMPGKGGLETLVELKRMDPAVPVILITKSEEEELMNDAIGRRIDDYLIKPVNPSQIFMACKRALEARQIREGHLTRQYVEEFNELQQMDSAELDWRGWAELHLRLSQWDVEFDRMNVGGLFQAHQDERRRLNIEFAHFIEQNYESWMQDRSGPLLSTGVFREYVAPHLKEKRKVYFIVVDCMRLDQWLAIQPLLEEFFEIDLELYYSILPTATPYSRNAIFSGLLPVEIARQYPEMWQESGGEERGKNRFEKELMELQIERLGIRVSPGPKYVKIYTNDEGSAVRRQISTYLALPLVAFVFNFVDILAHGRSESEILQELAPDESAFRSLMRSWFGHSALFEICKVMAGQDAVVVITSDHGSVLSKRSALVYGDRETSTNLRYKFGNNLVCDDKQAIHTKSPEKFGLPADAINKHYIMAKEDFYFVYPTRFHDYERQYRGTFQHGGVSLEEMVLPCAVMVPRR